MKRFAPPSLGNADRRFERWNDLIFDMQQVIRRKVDMLTGWVLARTSRAEYEIWSDFYHMPVPQSILDGFPHRVQQAQYMEVTRACRALRQNYGHLGLLIMEGGTPAQLEELAPDVLHSESQYSDLLVFAFLQANVPLLEWLLDEGYPVLRLFHGTDEPPDYATLILHFERAAQEQLRTLHVAAMEDGRHVYGLGLYYAGQGGRISGVRWIFRTLLNAAMRANSARIVCMRITAGALQNAQFELLDWLKAHHRFDVLGMWIWFADNCTWDVATLDWLYAQGIIYGSTHLTRRRVRHAWTGDSHLTRIDLPPGDVTKRLRVNEWLAEHGFLTAAERDRCAQTLTPPV